MKQTNPIIEKLRELYVLRKSVYIYQPRYLWDKNENKYVRNDDGVYKKINLYDKDMTEEKKKKWNFDKSLYIHIQEDSKRTIGVFGGKTESKFICFDVDYSNLDVSKFVAKKICEFLKDEMEIKNCYVSFSGGKGYHIEIFFKDLIENTLAQQFFNYVVNKIGVADKEFQNMYEGKVELRGCTYSQGVKIPLGTHQKTLQYCCYCSPRGIVHKSKEESEDYILTIEKISHKDIEDYFNKIGVSAVKNKSEPSNIKDVIQGENIIDKHKDLPIYNPDFDDMEARAIDYLKNGLQFEHTRHNVTILIAKYFKYLGCTTDQMLQDLLEWLNFQKGKYTTKEEDAIEDTKEIVAYVMEHDCSIVPRSKDISVTANEFNAIIKQCSQKNEKLLEYAMLIHSKRFSSSVGGVFYMTYDQMAETTQLDRSTCQRIVPRLEKQGVLEVVERNREKKGSYRKLPNRYKITLCIEISNTTNITYISDLYNKHEKDFTNCLQHYYTKEEAKKILPRRQYEAFFTSVA